MTTSRFADHDGVRIHYLDTGGDHATGDDWGAPVVFVPGMTDVAEDYREVLPLFGRRTAVVEVRGHGRSDAPPGGYDLATLSGDVAAVIDGLFDVGSPGPVHLVTFSRGTSAAIEWALKHPDRVRSLAIGDYLPEEMVPPSHALPMLTDGRWRGTPVRDRVDRDAVIGTYDAARPQSFWEPLSALQPPLLVARGGIGSLIDDTAWARYRRLFPDAQLIEFPDSPHDIFRPDRTRYPRLVRAHVDRADRFTPPNR
ncbi:alpha/beta fold hydrolase [Mycolicibacterium thermoresistibile]